MAATMMMSLATKLPHQSFNRMRVMARLAPEDFPNPNQMPLEPYKPRFDQIPYSISTPETLKSRLESQTSSQQEAPRRKFWRSRRRWGSYKKPTSKEAMTSSMISGVCAIASFKGVMALYEHVSANPLPIPVSNETLNEAVSTMVVGFGFLGVSLFALSSIGLGLLSFQLQQQKSSFNTTTMLKLVAWCVMFYSSLYNVEAQAMGASESFGRSCLGCHARGGNILQPRATLSLDDLKKNGILTTEDIFKITYFGKGRMPGFGETCTPKGQCTFGPRLSDEEIQALAEFVKSQAEENWPDMK